MHKAISIQQMGVLNRMLISLLDRVRLRRKPRSPIGPKISASTTAAVFKSSFRIKYPKKPKMPLMMKAYLFTAVLTEMQMTLYRALSAVSITLNE